MSANSSKPLKENVDKVMEDMKVKELVKHVFWVRRTDKAVAEKSHDVDLDKVCNHNVRIIMHGVIGLSSNKIYLNWLELII